MTIAKAPEPSAELELARASSAPRSLPHGLDPLALFTVLRITVARQNRGLRLLVLAGLFALPIAFAVLIRQYAPQFRWAPVESRLLFLMIFPALVPLSSLLLATGMVQDDVEEQTLTYLLIRPIARWAIYLAKLSGTVLVSWLRASIFTIATLAVIDWGQIPMTGGEPFRRAAIVAGLLAMALAAYSSLFGVLSLLVRRALVIGAIYIVVVEGIFGNIDFVIREATVIYHIRVLAVRWLDISGTDWSIDPATAVSASTSVIVLLSIAGVFAAIGAIAFASREFRVKTPEGS